MLNSLIRSQLNISQATSQARGRQVQMRQGTVLTSPERWTDWLISWLLQSTGYSEEF